MRMTERPANALTREQIEAFWRDGVICVRKLYSRDWVRRITDFMEDVMSRPSPTVGPRNGTTFETDMETWLTNDAVRDFVLFGPSAHIAQRAFGSTHINFYYDQIFVKDKLSPLPTPWHHDFTFWPLNGNQIASLWTSVDSVDAESSALEFVAGSHKWPQRFRAIGADGTDFTTGHDRDELNIETDRSRCDIVSWDLEPGDALLFHALTVHGARGNRSPDRKRRAIATRWCGDDVTYRPVLNVEKHRHGMKPGDRFSDDIFPQILPEIIDAQIARRMAGPIFPDPDIMHETLSRLMQFDRAEVPLDT